MDATNLNFSDTPPGHRVLVTGVGGAGCNTLSSWFEQSDEAELPDTLAVHTDSQVLAHTRASRKIQLGSALANGMSTGGDTKLGQHCAEHDAESLKEVFRDYDLVFFIVGLGGGTGTGATPVLVRLAGELGAFTLCLAVTPFLFEGDTRRRTAEMGLASLKEHAHGVITFPNQRLFELVKEKVNLVNSLKVADTYLSHGITTLWKLMNEPGLMNLDFNDIRSLVQHSDGTCTMATVEHSGKNRIDHVVKAVLSMPLLDQGAALTKAKGLLIGIVGGPNFRLDEFEAIVKGITEVCRRDVHLYLGVGLEPSLGTSVSVTVLVSEQWIETREVELAETPAAGTGNLPVQEDLNLGPVNQRGRFEGSDRTYIGGQDLDIPTFVRRGIKLSGG